MHRTSPRRPTRLAAASALLLLLAPAAGRANGFALDIQGTFANATAGAGAGAPRDPAAQFVNPAALAGLEGTQVTAGGMLVFPRAPFTDGGSTLAVGAPNAGPGGDGATSGQVPWLFASHRLSPALTAGFGLTAPFGLATEFDAGFVGRYQGIESRIEALAFGPALAWRLSDQVAVGAGIAARRDHVVQSLALDMGSQCVGGLTALGDPDPAGTCAGTFGLAPGQSDALGRFSGDGWGWTATLGVTVAPAEGTLLGAAWRHESRSTVKGDETFALALGTPEFLAAAGSPTTLTGSRARLPLRLPDFVTLHGAQRLGPVTLLAAWQWTRWSPFDVVALSADDPATGLSFSSRQGYRNAWRLAVGAAWAVRPGLDLHAGLAWEQTPVRDAYRQATLPETDSIIAAAGGEIQLVGGLSSALGWQHVAASQRAAVDQTSPDGGDRLVGTARTSADLVLLQLTYRR
jgi:long-chain fatty acid transport protein